MYPDPESNAFRRLAREVAPPSLARARAHAHGRDAAAAIGADKAVATMMRAASFRPAKLGPPRPALRMAAQAQSGTAAVFGDVGRG